MTLPSIIMQSKAFFPVISVNFRGDGDNGSGVGSADDLGDGRSCWDGNSGLDDSPRGGSRTGPEGGGDGGDDPLESLVGTGPRAVILRGEGPRRGRDFRG